MTTLTLRDSRADGTTAAEKLMALGCLQPEHFTNPGADAWGEEGCNIGDAAWTAFPESRHYQFISELQSERMEVLKQDERTGVITAWRMHGPDFEDSHWETFLDGFETEAKRIAFERGWEVQS